MADINNYDELLATDSPAAKLLRNINTYRYNPTNIQAVITNYLSDMLDGKVRLVDPTNPVVFTMEASAVTSAAAVIENANNTRRLYPALAQSPEDLYIHMSDKDFVGRFAIPATTTYSLLLNKAEVISKIEQISASNPGFSRTLKIPRDSEVIVDNKFVFSMLYGVDIQKLAHGGLEITLDTDRTTPLGDISTNVLKWETRVDANKVEYLLIDIPVTQYKASLMNGAISIATGYVDRFSFANDFYCARVFYQSGANTGNWVEMKTTHTDQVYDASTPTAVLKVINGILTVYVPQIYTNNQLVGGSLKTIIYTTNGEMNLDFSNYKQDNIIADWRSLNPGENTPDEKLGISGFVGLKTKAVFIPHRVSGGSKSLSFEKLRERVIYNAIGPQNIPITNVQIETTLDRMGYDIVENIDIVTNRVFLASKAMPDPEDDKLITPVASTIGTLISTIKEVTDDYAYGVYDNSATKRLTLRPEMHYRAENGQIFLCTESEMSIMTNPLITDDDKANFINQRKYLYTPFHHILDYSEDEFSLRPYYLNEPVAESVQFVQDNDSRGYQVAIDRYELKRYSDPITHEEGWRLVVTTKSSKEYQDIDKAPSTYSVEAQLSFIPVGEFTRTYKIHSEMIKDPSTNERTFIFNLPSNFDIDSNNELYLKDWIMFGSPGIIKTKLLNTFDIVFVTNVRPTPGNPSLMDNMVYSTEALPQRPYVITHQKIKLSFGAHLDNLWSRSRSSYKNEEWSTYSANVIDTYAEDVYEIDPVTGSIFSIDGAGNIVYNKIHNAGDVVKDANDNVVYKHLIGDIILDSSGKPIPVSNTSGINRHIDLFFLEGAYRYANDWAAIKYREDVVSSVVKWVSEDLDKLEDNLLEQTRIYFYPKANIGRVKVLVSDGSVIYLQASQSFEIDLYVSKQVYVDSELRNRLVRNTIEVLNKALMETVISVSTVTNKLRESFGSDVLSIKLSGLGGAEDYQAVTILDESERLSIRKILSVTQDNTLLVKEDVVVNFIRHEVVTD